MSVLWPSLDELPSLIALAPVWQDLLGENFEAFQALCLILSAVPVRILPCSLDRRCEYCVIRLPFDPPDPSDPQLSTVVSQTLPPGTVAIGICRTDPPVCPVRPISQFEITPLQVS